MYMLGGGCSPCCGAPCALGSCSVTFNFFDENSCEDDVFDFYLENPTTGAKRFIQTVDLATSPPGGCLGASGYTYANIDIPVEVTEYDFDENCEVYVVLDFKSANCCNTYTRFRIIRPDGSILLGTYFNQGGLRKKYTWSDLCEEAPPPPDPKACCLSEVKCSDSAGNPITVGECSGIEPECCVKGGNTQQSCSSATPPPVTLCQNGYETRETPPYDCTVDSPALGSLQIIIQNIQVTEISSSLGSRPAAWYDSLRTAVESQLNGAWVFSSVCISEVQETFPTVSFQWTEPVIPPSSTGNTYTVSISLTATVDVCTREAAITANVSGPVAVGINRTKNPITPTYVTSRCPVNGVNQLCVCRNFSGNWDSPAGTGSVDVRPA